ncbi:MAG: GTP 3',8-cyclase MoaA [Dehalococcoidia bacterium]|nr:GTP 3',8-cyclase MoaA [Dehalococcoidia bacterium]
MRDLRISVTDRCNFRCPYCMPAEIYGERYQFLPQAQILTFEETTRLTRIFVKLGVNKLRLTGGEPLVRTEVEKLVGMLAKVPGAEDITLTTNGYLLEQKAQALKDAGLQRITVSLDSLNNETFARMNGRGYGTERVLAGIRKAQEVGLWPIKLNCVVMRGVNENDIVDLARHFKGTGVIVRFIEYMDVGNLNGWKLDQVVPAREIVDRISAVFPLEPIDRNYVGEVAERWRYVDGTGEVGVIASVTQPFCANCTRARLSTDGKLFTCLFGTTGKDLKTPMRAGASDDELEALIRGTWGTRTDRYSEMRAALTEKPKKKIEMFQIGG